MHSYYAQPSNRLQTLGTRNHELQREIRERNKVKHREMEMKLLKKKTENM